MTLLEAVTELRKHTQRAIASAHQIDGLVETPQTAQVIASARQLLVETDKLAVVLSAPAPAAAPAAAEPPSAEPPAAPKPLEVGEDVIVDVTPTFHRRGRIKQEYFSNLHNERAFWCEWERGHFEALESECRRP